MFNELSYDSVLPVAENSGSDSEVVTQEQYQVTRLEFDAPLVVKTEYPGNNREKKDFEVNITDHLTKKEQSIYAISSQQQTSKENSQSFFILGPNELHDFEDVKRSLKSAVDEYKKVPVSFNIKDKMMCLGVGSSETIHHGVYSDTHRDTEVAQVVLHALKNNASIQDGEITITNTDVFSPPNMVSLDIVKNTQDILYIDIQSEKVPEPLRSILTSLEVKFIDTVRNQESEEASQLLELVRLVGQSVDDEFFAHLSEEKLTQYFLVSFLYPMLNVHSQHIYRNYDTRESKSFYSQFCPSALGSYTSFDEEEKPIDVYSLGAVASKVDAEYTFEQMQKHLPEEYIEIAKEQLSFYDTGLQRAAILFESPDGSEHFFMVGSNHQDILRFQEVENPGLKPLYEYDVAIGIDVALLSSGLRNRKNVPTLSPDRFFLPLEIKITEYRGDALGSKAYQPGEKTSESREASRKILSEIISNLNKYHPFDRNRQNFLCEDYSTRIEM